MTRLYSRDISITGFYGAVVNIAPAIDGWTAVGIISVQINTTYAYFSTINANNIVVRLTDSTGTYNGKLYWTVLYERNTLP